MHFSRQSPGTLALWTGALVLLIIGQAHAAAIFPAQGIDHMSSLGSFTINVTPDFRPFVKGIDALGNFTSPYLFDTDTQIGRSGAIVEGSAADIGGTPVGSGVTSVSNADFSSIPISFQQNSGVNREVHTEILNFNLVDSDPSGSGMALRAGSQNPNLLPGTRRSVGEVESLSGTGDPANDFLAQSFFDVFVNIFTPGLPTLYNQTPLLIENFALTGFPPNVVYIHGGAEAVPILFATDFGPFPKDTLFGYLTLAGHGVGPQPKPGKELEVELELRHQVDTALSQVEPLPLPTVPEPSTISLMGFGLAGLLAHGRKRAMKRISDTGVL